MANNHWGTDASRFAGLCLRGQRAWRVFLPAECKGQEMTWRSVAELHRNLEQVLDGWSRSINLGRWRCADVGLAAPPYADSVILSGPPSLDSMLRDAGLEGWPVAPSHSLPPMTT